MSILLASASPRRRELLAALGFSTLVRPADVDESALPGEHPVATAHRLALAKVEAASRRETGAGTAATGAVGATVAIGADTIVWLDASTVLGKPADAATAAHMLRTLSGRMHRVTTGFAARTLPDGPAVSGVATTRVTFYSIPEPAIDAYCGTEEPLDKAGAYGIQGAAAAWVAHISGSWSTVVGLPVSQLLDACRRAGVPLDAARSAT